MCSGRVDLTFVMRALSKGMDGVFIGGCHLGDCHYVTEGNFHALSMVKLCKKLLETMGINPERLRLEWISAGEGIRFAEVMNDFGKQIKTLGRLGSSEGLTPEAVDAKFKAALKILPYMRLVERERLRVKFATEQEYDEFFNSEAVNGLFQNLVGKKLALSQILNLLEAKDRTLGEIAESLQLTPSQVSSHLSTSAKHGLIRYHEAEKRFALA